MRPWSQPKCPSRPHLVLLKFKIVIREATSFSSASLGNGNFMVEAEIGECRNGKIDACGWDRIRQGQDKYRACSLIEFSMLDPRLNA